MFLLLPSVPVYCIFHSPFWISVGNILRISNFFLWFWWSAMFQLYTSSRSGLAFIWKTYKKYFIPQFQTPGANFSVFHIPSFGFGGPSVSLPSTSSTLGLAYLDKCTK